jgi:hypothetical protein
MGESFTKAAYGGVWIAARRSVAELLICYYAPCFRAYSYPTLHRPRYVTPQRRNEMLRPVYLSEIIL